VNTYKLRAWAACCVWVIGLMHLMQLGQSGVSGHLETAARCIQAGTVSELYTLLWRCMHLAIYQR
jgi:hypothetical protein